MVLNVASSLPVRRVCELFVLNTNILRRGVAATAAAANDDGDVRAVRLIGVCEDRNSSFARGPARAPVEIRKALASPSANPYSENHGGINTAEVVINDGDINDGGGRLLSPVEVQGVVRERVRRALDGGGAPLVLGGDHSVSFPAVVATAEWCRAQNTAARLAVVHFDAHTDLYDDFEGNPLSHASPFARIMEHEEEHAAAAAVEWEGEVRVPPEKGGVNADIVARDAHFSRVVLDDTWNQNEEFLLMQRCVALGRQGGLVLQHDGAVVATFKHCWAYEWEVADGRTQDGCGDLVFTDGHGAFAVVECKHVPLGGSGTTQRTKRTASRKKVREQAERYSSDLKSKLAREGVPHHTIAAFAFTNEGLEQVAVALDNDGSRTAQPPDADVQARLVQVGIRTLTPHHRAQIERFGVRVMEARDMPAADSAHSWVQFFSRHIRREDLVYVSFDLDVLDPAHAPGVSHHEPGGMSVRQAIAAINAIPNRVVGADVVELNPERDVNGVTAMAAGKIAKEIIGKICAGRQG